MFAGDRVYFSVKALLENLKCWINTMATIVLTASYLLRSPLINLH